MKKKIYNLVFGTLGQVIILALGVLVPRFVLKSYGDEANGLVNAVNQLFTYMALIEAGVGQSALQALYRPVVEDDGRGKSAVMSATQRMFRKLTLIYLGFTVVIALAFPLFVDVSAAEAVSLFGSQYLAVVMIVLVQGLSNAISFYFYAALKQLLLADGRNYTIVAVTTVMKAITSVARILLINAAVNIVLLQFVYLAVAVLEATVYRVIFKRLYPEVDLHEEPDGSALAQKNAFLFHELSGVIFSSTDVLVLSVFCDLRVASIYAAYNLVFSSLNTLIGQVHNGCYYVLGQSYCRGREEYIGVHDAYDTFYIPFVFACMSTACLLTAPFVAIYTAGVTDVNYVDPYLPILFCLIQLLSCCRITSANLIKLAGHAKKTVPRAMLEAGINLAVSIVLVNFLGIYGVLLGTVAALLYRTNDMIIYANRRILGRSPWRTYRTVLLNSILFAAIFLLTRGLDLSFINSFPRFLVAGAVCFVAALAVYLGINAAASPKSTALVFGKLKARRARR